MEIEIIKAQHSNKVIEPSVSALITNQISLAINTPIKPFVVLDKIRDKVIITLKNKQPLPTHKDLINLVSDPYMLIAAYKSVITKKGAMTEAQPPPDFVLDKLSPEQQKVAQLMYRALA